MRVNTKGIKDHLDRAYELNTPNGRHLFRHALQVRIGYDEEIATMLKYTMEEIYEDAGIEQWLHLVTSPTIKESIVKTFIHIASEYTRYEKDGEEFKKMEIVYKQTIANQQKEIRRLKREAKKAG